MTIAIIQENAEIISSRKTSNLAVFEVITMNGGRILLEAALFVMDFITMTVFFDVISGIRPKLMLAVGLQWMIRVILG